MKFRKKAVVIEAIRYGGPQAGSEHDLGAVERFGAKAQVLSESLWAKGDYTIQVWDSTGKSLWLNCPVGYWVVKTGSEFLVHSDEEFRMFYEPVEGGE